MAPAQRQLIWIWLVAKVQIIAAHEPFVSLLTPCPPWAEPVPAKTEYIYTHVNISREQTTKASSSTLEMKINGAYLEIGKHGGFLCFSARKNKYNTRTYMHESSVLRYGVCYGKKRSVHKGWRYLGDVRACVRHKTPLRGKSLLSYAYRRCAPEIWKIFYVRWPAPALSYPAARHKWISTSHICVACEMTRVAMAI